MFEALLRQFGDFLSIDPLRTTCPKPGFGCTHLLVIFLSLVAAAWIWHRRARSVAGKDVEAGGPFAGALGGPADASAESMLMAIDEPARAAVVLMVALGDCKQEGRDAVYEEIERHAIYLFDTDDVDDILHQAYGTIDKGPKLADVIRILAPVWNARLDPAQKTELLQMAHEVAAVGGYIEPRQAAGLRRLREVLRIDQRA